MYNTSMLENLFIYGTLRDDTVQMKVIGKHITGTQDTLLKYEKSTIDINGRTYPIALPNEKSQIDGETIKLTQEELAKVDEYETDAYQRVKIILASNTEAWVYTKRS